MSIKYRFVFRHLRRGNSSSCDIEHTDFELEATVRENNSPARSTHTAAAPNFPAFKHTTGTTLGELKLASNGRILIRMTFQSQ
ncbi:MAG TPA: hypothetical protein VFB65_16005, partial [Pyrinomonadaceae bacterium]|nr:hypothetical protein [Pyrinomonadaceae bacterium]